MGALIGLDHLQERGFVQQCTNLNSLQKHLTKGSITFYVGFDPTADSFHVGNLVPIMAMTWLQRAGHRPIVVMGGGTSLIGDPSGKDRDREMLGSEQVAHNLTCQRIQLSRFLDIEHTIIVDNAEWLRPLHYIDFLRDVGRHFSVNRMISAAGIRQRFKRSQGLNFIEFNYHLLQSYDYLVLFQRYGCSLQMGGNDQWFHILGGADLIKQEHGAIVHGLTLPLLVTSAGRKMGKTDCGALWLDPTKVSPYDYFQYWMNVDDHDVGHLLRLMTFLPLDHIVELEHLQGADLNEAKRILAKEATALAHGEEAARQASVATTSAFSGGSTEGMPTYCTTLPAPLLDVLVVSKMCQSRSKARHLIQQGGVSIGETRIENENHVLDNESVMWVGKKRVIRVIRSS